MIDALLYAVRDTIRNGGLNLGVAECEIMDDGKPPPRAGNVFAAVHDGRTRPGQANERNLYELYDFSVTLTMRVVIPIDRIGDQLIARNIKLSELGRRQGFDHKLDQLRGLLHSNWGMTVLTSQSPNSANDNLSAWVATGTVYGFCEPARYQGAEVPRLVSGDWFGAEPEEAANQFAVKSELRFANAKRFQPQTAAAGVFV